MSERHMVFPTTGGVSIMVDEESISILQEGVMGDKDAVVTVPRVLFMTVLEAIFISLEASELREIAAKCESCTAAALLRKEGT